MTTSITKSQVDLVQGETPVGGVERKFGYVCGDDGGFFFTWMPTLEATLESVEKDEQDGDGELDAGEVVEFLREYLPTTKIGKQMWATDEE